jgi:hypothetical protein
MIIVKQMLKRKALIEKELEAIDLVLDALEKAGITDENLIVQVRSEESRKHQSEKMKASWAKRRANKLKPKTEDEITASQDNSAWLKRIENKS